MTGGITATTTYCAQAGVLGLICRQRRGHTVQALRPGTLCGWGQQPQGVGAGQPSSRPALPCTACLSLQLNQCDCGDGPCAPGHDDKIAQSQT